MAAGNVHRVIRAPGHVVIDPTDLSTPGTDNAYGGTLIGKTNACVVQSLGTPFRVESEGLGEITDVLEANNRWAFACFLRGWDDDAIREAFSEGNKTLGTAAGNYEQGGTSSHSVFAVPGTRTPGQSTLESSKSRAVILLYVPDDVIHVPAVLVYSGIPDWTEGAELAFQRGSELGLPLTIECLRDSNDNTLRIGRLADLSLS